MLLIYRLFSYVIFGLGLPVWLLLRSRLRSGLRRRLGHYRETPWPPGPAPRIWFHGASAGDVRALRPVIRKVRAGLPQATLVLSVITDSGFKVAQDELTEDVNGITYAPIDLPGATRSAVRAIRPDVLVFEYTELWPNLLAAAQAEGVIQVLGNGRLHPRRMWGYRWMTWLFGSPLSRLDRLLMRSDDDAARALALGAPKARIEVTGNTKFDDVAPVDEPPRALADGRWFVAGSTHAEDEGPVLAAFAAIRSIDEEARLLLVPRYPERAPAVADAARRWRWSVSRSGLGPDAAVADDDVVVVDVMGRLRVAYHRARIAFVGGSFGRRGGHNILEPASLGVPVLAGPDLANAADAVALLRGHGLIQVADASTLARVTVDVWSDETLRRRLSSRAQAAVEGAVGASERNAQTIIELANISTSRGPASESADSLDG